MRVAGLDLSLTCTGIALDAGARTLKPKATGMDRLQWVRDRVLQECGALGIAKAYAKAPWVDQERIREAAAVDLVVVEGYAFNSSSSAHSLGELGGVVRLALWEAGVPFVEVSPAGLKKFACGVGNARKDAVLVAATRRLGYEGHDHNEADALWLRAMALDHYGEPVVSVPAEHRKALAAVKWPALDVVGVA